MKISSKVALIRRALELYEDAVASREKISVSQVAHKFSRGRGSSAERGRQFHNRIWSFDPYDILNYEKIALPFPLAWRFRWGWLYGIADQLVFEYGLPKAVIEYKSYKLWRKSERVQASLYGLLVMLVFAVKPGVYLSNGQKILLIKDWRMLALKSLRNLGKELGT